MAPSPAVETQSFVFVHEPPPKTQALPSQYSSELQQCPSLKMRPSSHQHGPAAVCPRRRVQIALKQTLQSDGATQGAWTASSQ